MTEPANDPTGPEREIPDTIRDVAVTVADLRSSWRNQPQHEIDDGLARIVRRLLDLAPEKDDGGLRLNIPFTLTYFREAKDIGRQWAQERLDHSTLTSTSGFFNSSWVERNARVLLALHLEDYTKGSADYELACKWISALSNFMSRVATRHWKKLVKTP